MADVMWNPEGGDLKKVKDEVLRWDDLKNPIAPLTEKQLNAIDKLAEAIKNQPLPSELPEYEVVTGTDGNRIETVEKFLTKYSELEDKILERDNENYLGYYEQLCECRDQLDEVLSEVNNGLNDLGVLLEQYKLVSHNTNALNNACQQILDEQTKLIESSQEIKRRLEYFTCLDGLQQRLSNPTLSVTSDTFFNILNRLDDCLEYINANSNYKEAASYSARFKYCLAKAINMMKLYISQTLISAKNQVLPSGNNQANEGGKTDGSNFAIFYGKFQASSFKIKKIIYNIEQRLEKSEEYANALTDCHETYFEQRRQLMSQSVHAAVVELSVRHRGDHCTLVRSGCAFLVHICTDEYQLFFQFFNKPTPLLTNYLEGLCGNLYDILRPIIIHVNHLETLAELCSILRLEMIEEHVQNNRLPLEAFSKVIWQLLQDVQERLVFRAHLYLQSDILNYKPSPGDLAYPEKLEMMESIAISLQEGSAGMRRSESKSSIVSIASGTSQEVERINSSEPVHEHARASRTGNSPADLHGMWYPPVRRTLVTLSRLYRCVERPIFQGLSQEALAMCVQSIAQASNAICNRSSVIDGKLFEMKHLLILREQVAPFQVDFTIKEMALDFTKVKSAAFSLLQKRNRLFSLSSNNALLEFLLEGTPTVKELTIDSRKEVDKQLKLSCEAFIEHSTDLLISSLTKFLNKVKTFTEMVKDKNTAQVQFKLCNEPFASPEKIAVAVQESQRQIKSKLQQIQRSMQLYLANKETELILYRPIKNNVINAYQSLQQIVSENGYSEEAKIIMALPTHEQVLMLLSTSSLAVQHPDIEPIMESSASPKV
ncbi:UNVERIFIED_CONTAM: hypothetical protein PYX00_010230 [Menopon gallinae]|uniref:Conserved oligomeric Golgi complex subunit 3 n=1 Tax=Menopon gallinae TaxID=328185 RepID=A0AAW2HEL7_9NEOP